MTFILRNLNKSITLKLKEAIEFKKVFFFFMLNGIYICYQTKHESILELPYPVVPVIAFFVFIGFVFGNIAGFITSYLIIIIGKIFRAKNSYKQILKAHAIAYRPYIYTFILMVIEIILDHYRNGHFIQTHLISYTLLLGLIKITVGILAIWSFVLLIKGLSIAQELTIGKLLINYLLATVTYAPIYYLLMSKLN